MARPKKPEGEVRDGFLRIRVTAAERAALDAAARARKLDTSSWARAELLLLAERIGGRKPRPDRGES